MPYSSVTDVPDYVPKAKRKQWLEVFNSAYGRAKGTDKERESSAFAQANAVAGPNAKKLGGDGTMKKGVEYTPVASMPEEACQFCIYYWKNGKCEHPAVIADETVPHNADGCAIVAATGWCNKFESRIGTLEPTNADSGERLKAQIPERLRKLGVDKLIDHIPFCKVDAQKREVWGIVTAEVPDKDDEVCDYAKSKPYYEATIEEQAARSDGENYMPLREMHINSAVGKGIGYEFRDTDREIFFGFKVVDDRAWNKVEERVYTGFSHGGVKVGEMVPDPVFKGCMRYVAKPVEISLVDNPCLGIARFTYVSKTGEVTMRKNRSVEDRVVSMEKFVALRDKVDELRKELITKLPWKIGLKKEARTKRVAGEDLPASAFLIVGDPERTETWNLPVKFSTDAKTKSHIRNALARINQVKGISDTERESARKKLWTLAAKHGIEVDKEKIKIARIFKRVRNVLRGKINLYARKHGDPGYLLTFIDSELGKLGKGMYEVSCLAQHVQCLTCLFYQVCSEQEYEGDENSPLPDLLESNLNDLMDTLVAMVAEEVEEQRGEIAERKEATAEL